MNYRKTSWLLTALTFGLLSVPPSIVCAQTVGAGSTPTKRVPLLSGTGKHRRKVTTANRDAQRYFDQGLNLLYAFNHDEAIRSFRQAAELDPGCAMAYWGIATAYGPHINLPLVPPDRAKMAWESVQKAQANVGSATQAEKGLIDALSKRFADPQPENRRPLDEAYAAAMRELWHKFPEDSDIGVLFAESVMDLRPWDLWTLDRQPQPETPEILATLEKVLHYAPEHPMALHLYIHAVEAGPHPEKAVVAANRLRQALPGLGHMVHMPSHIDVLTGAWQKAINANVQAIAVDREYTQKNRKIGFYRVYKAHNQHMLAFAASMRGESKRAVRAIREMVAEMPDDWKRENAFIADGFIGMLFEVLMRFGRWQEILAEPEPAEIFPMARTLYHIARAAAFNAMEKPKESETEQQAFREAAAKLPKEAVFGNNPASLLFAVADALLTGEHLMKAGRTEEGVAALRKAVTTEDQLRYDEPPDWFYPTRHALGAALLLAGKPAEAETVYRDDLKHWPQNGWSLYGLSRSLEAQQKATEAADVRKQFQEIWKASDIRLESSCLCLTIRR